MLQYILAVAFVLFCWYNLKTPKRTLPPGPWGLPVVGYLPFLGSHPHLTFMEMRKKYGDVFRLRLGSFPAVVVNGVDTVKHTLAKTGDNFIGRPHFSTNLLFDDYLAFGLYRPAWKTHKKFLIQAIHSFVNERNESLKTIFSEEISIIVQEVLDTKEEPFNPMGSLYTLAASIPYQICYGFGTNVREDSDFLSYMSVLRPMTKSFEAGNPADVMPWLGKLFPGLLRPVRNFLDGSLSVRSRKAADHKATFQKDNIRDVTDAILGTNFDDPECVKCGFKEDQFFTSLDEIFGAAYDTNGTLFHWLLLYMVVYPEIQKAVHSEIMEYIGDGRQPKLSDRKNLPLTEATIAEVLRMNVPNPLAIPHMALVDSKINGYDIPKDTTVLFNLHSVGHDPEFWENPTEFRPERFLRADGTLNTDLTKSLISFSAGPRKCPGEQLARMQTFLMFTSLIQRFQFCPVQEHYDLESVHGLSDCPKPYKLRAKIRQQDA